MAYMGVWEFSKFVFTLYNARLNEELSMLAQTLVQYLLIKVFSVLSTGLL